MNIRQNMLSGPLPETGNPTQTVIIPEHWRVLCDMAYLYNMWQRDSALPFFDQRPGQETSPRKPKEQCSTSCLAWHSLPPGMNNISSRS